VDDNTSTRHRSAQNQRDSGYLPEHMHRGIASTTREEHRRLSG
jgi:hypothetical protein